MESGTGLLIVTVVIATLCVVGLVLLWLRQRRARGVQLALAGVAVVGLHVSGLMALLWEGTKRMWSWSAQSLGETPTQIGLGLIALGVVGIVVVGIVARRHAEKQPRKQTGGSDAGPQPHPASVSASSPQSSQSPAADSEMDEVEAILKNRGIT